MTIRQPQSHYLSMAVVVLFAMSHVPCAVSKYSTICNHIKMDNTLPVVRTHTRRLKQVLEEAKLFNQTENISICDVCNRVLPHWYLVIVVEQRRALATLVTARIPDTLRQ